MRNTQKVGKFSAYISEPLPIWITLNVQMHSDAPEDEITVESLRLEDLYDLQYLIGRVIKRLEQ